MQGALWELGGVPEVLSDRQPVGSHARVEGERRARSERAVCGGAGALRAAVYEDEPEGHPTRTAWPSRVTTGSRAR